ncbi:hypothetical protein HPP92_023930 [Vanilla planifolia]|uniref:Protein FLX-like 3 n=1 Tax=Vanilla planifolia TaxID=51239 RepID=A0A835UC35_VANPL|nr:hypothetical protein HPP92_023930 [Vanilla planifolia]
MAGRGRVPRHLEQHVFRDGPQPLPRRGHGPMPLHPIEEEIAIRRDEIRRLRADNHLLVEENVALRREIAAIKEDLGALGPLSSKIRADKESQARELIEKGLKLEAELRALEPVRAELVKLKSEAQKLDALRQELSSEVQNMTKELKHLQAENQQVPTLRLEIDGLHQELVRARRAYEYEKKANGDQVEQMQVLEKNLGSMAREVEKLRAEQAHSLEKRSWAPGPGAYGDAYGAEMGLYGSGPWSSYDHRGFPRH